jgi:hypothetical protein
MSLQSEKFLSPCVLSTSLMNRRRLFTLPGVKAEELWAAVGTELARIRNRKGYGTTYAFHQAHRDLSPTVNTLNEIEIGRPKYTESLTAYCRALGVMLPDVLRNALGENAEHLDADAVALARAFQDNAHPEVKRAVQTLLDVTGPPRPEPVPSPAAPPATKVVAGDTRPTARKRQGMRKR